MTTFLFNLLMPLFAYLSQYMKPILNSYYCRGVIDAIKPICMNVFYKIAYHCTACQQFLSKYIPKSGFKKLCIYLPSINLMISDTQCVEILLENEKTYNLDSQFVILKVSENDLICRCIFNIGIKYSKPIINKKHLVLSAINKKSTGDELDYTQLINEYTRCVENNIDLSIIVDDSGNHLLDIDDELKIITQMGDEIIFDSINSILKLEHFKL